MMWRGVERGYCCSYCYCYCYYYCYCYCCYFYCYFYFYCCCYCYSYCYCCSLGARVTQVEVVLCMRYAVASRKEHHAHCGRGPCPFRVSKAATSVLRLYGHYQLARFRFSVPLPCFCCGCWVFSVSLRALRPILLPVVLLPEIFLPALRPAASVVLIVSTCC